MTAKKAKPTWKIVRDIVIEQLKGKAVKLALKKILGSAVMAGPQGWIISFLAGYLYDWIGEPFIQFAFRRGMFFVEQRSGKLIVKSLKEAKEAGDEDAYDDTIDKL